VNQLAEGVQQITGLATGDRGDYDLGAIARVIWSHAQYSRLGFFSAAEYVRWRNGEMGRGQYADDADVVAQIDNAPRLAVWSNGAIEVKVVPVSGPIDIVATWTCLSRATQRLIGAISAEMDRQDAEV